MVNDMYEYIKGIISEIESNYIVIDNAGIGYLVYTPNPYAFHMNEEAKVYIYQNVKEDELSLYGFQSKEEKQLFLNPKSSDVLLYHRFSGIFSNIKYFLFR